VSLNQDNKSKEGRNEDGMASQEHCNFSVDRVTTASYFTNRCKKIFQHCNLAWIDFNRLTAIAR
jgi:hypothetical protein